MSGQKKFIRGKGCAQCDGTGYAGRTAIHEILLIEDQLRDLIYQQATMLKLKEAAIAAGFESIQQDAAKKVMGGVISVAEFVRTLG